jgi:hypothetical protein
MTSQQTLFEWSDDKKRHVTRQDQIFAAFVRFHRKYPKVWKWFKHFAFKVIDKKRTVYSAYSIFEQIRWHTTIELGEEEIKLNNYFRPLYARMFHAAFPEHDGLFRTRHMISNDKPAHENNKLIFYTGLPGDERELLAVLAKLGTEPQGDADAA